MNLAGNKTTIQQRKIQDMILNNNMEIMVLKNNATEQFILRKVRRNTRDFFLIFSNRAASVSCTRLL